jgi:hypothetical protein
MKTDAEGLVVAAMKPGMWAKQRFCSRSCAKKQENPMANSEAREKMAATLRRIGHKPPIQGGNGKPMPKEQGEMLAALGEGWTAELAIPTRIPKGNGYPTCYKVDLGNPTLMIAIELDGNSHHGARRLQDRKKDDLLTSFGWRVLRVPNTKSRELYSTYRSADTLLTSLMEYSSTTAI